jgi:hypothetical protein
MSFYRLLPDFSEIPLEKVEFLYRPSGLGQTARVRVALTLIAAMRRRQPGR